MSRSPIVCSLVAAALLLVACGGGDADSTVTTQPVEPASTESAPPTETEGGPITIDDDLGSVELDAAASTVVTTSDEATEMIVALGLQPIGVASSRVDPAASADQRFAGYFLTTEQLGDPEFVGGEVLNFEAIAALDPDLIVHAADDDRVETLRGIAPTAVFDVQVPGRWQAALIELGDATNRGDEAATLIEAYEVSLAAARTELTGIAEEHPELTVIYPNYRGGEENFVFDADFALAAVVPDLGFDLVGIDAAEPAFPGVGVISTERYGDLADGTDTIIAIGPDEWSGTASGPLLDSLPVPVVDVSVDEGRPSTGPLSAPVYLQRFLDALTEQYGDASDVIDQEVDEEAPAPSGPTTIEHVYGTTEVPQSPERIVALSEEFLLADLIALGITPIASTSNDANSFGGVDPAATENIEIIATAEFNIERLAALEPDLLLAYPVYIELVGYDVLSAIAPTVAIGDDDSDWKELLEQTAEVFGLQGAADEQIAEVDAQLEAARATLDGSSMSVLSVSPGPFIRAYVEGGVALTETMAEVGVSFVPDGSTDGADANGRVVLSLEQLELLQGDTIVLLQTTVIEGEDAALAEVVESPLWQTLPGVQNGRVITFDRLAYPGARGTGAFADDLAAAVAAL